MDMKNALAVCLISLFSASLVVLIARSLDSQAASQLEPQLTKIAEELEALRKQGGIAAAAGDSETGEVVGNGLVVYYFHSNSRCVTCKAVESQTKKTLDTDFAPQLASGEIVWKMLNYEKRSGAELANKFEVKDPVVVLAKMKNDKMTEWSRLDKVMALAGDKAALGKYVREEIERMLAKDKQPDSAKQPPAIPIP